MSELLNKAYKEMREKATDTLLYSKTRVRCLNDGFVYSSLSQAARETGCSKSHISAVCNGKLKTAHGMKFVFEDDYAVKIRKNKPKQSKKREYNKQYNWSSNEKRYEEIDWSNQKAIYSWNDNETYKSAREASRKTGVPTSTILHNCKANEGIEDDDLLKYTRSGWAFTFE